MDELARILEEINQLTHERDDWQLELLAAERGEAEAQAAYDSLLQHSSDDLGSQAEVAAAQAALVRAKRRTSAMRRIIEMTERELKTKEEGLALARSHEDVAMAATSKEDKMGVITLDATQKLQIGMDRMFGVLTKESERIPAGEIPAFRSFHEAFRVITGHNLPDMLNHPIADAKETISAATWVNVLGTSMHKRLIKDYQAVEYFESAIIRPRPGGVANFKTQESLRVKYFGDLSQFDPEAQDYPEITEPGDEKISYAVVQKGNILTITRKTMLNDDLGAVLKMVGRLGRAARRTHAKFIWNFWIANTAYEVDALAWFHATHANLQSTALTPNFAGATEIISALTKLGDMTEPGSGEKLGINLTEPVWLAVPHALMGVALQLNIAPQVTDGSNLVANPVYHRFGENNERIILNPLFTDATDWGIFRSPDVVDSIEIGYLNDQQEPEFFTASVPTIGQMFVADKQQFKVRHEYGGDIVDFRGAVKAVVAG